MNCTRTLLVLVGMLCPAVAQATDYYPDEIERRYALYPDCTLCHENNKGGERTVTRPFGLQTMAHGAAGNDLPSLQSALDEMEDEGVASDADWDGYGDIEELEAGTDPNDTNDPPWVEPPDTTTTASTSAGGTDASGSDNGGTHAGGTSAGGAGDDDDDQGDDGGPSPIAGASTTGRVRPPKPPAQELPPSFGTGCSVSTPARAAGSPALLLASMVLVAGLASRRAGRLQTS